MARAPRPEDLYDLRIPTDLDLSPDGRFVVFSVKSVAPGKDGYRSSLWLAPADGGAPARQLTVGSQSDTTPRWSPDGTRIAFLSDRGAVLQAGGGGAKAGKAEAPKEGGTQVWLLPFAEGGEARQLTELPKNVEGLDWAPDGRRLAVVSTADSTDPGAEAGAQAGGWAQRPTRDSSTRCATSSTARASSTSGSRASGWSTPRAVPPSS